jgi:ATP-dependent 26S proteasome regulatory subunit
MSRLVFLSNGFSGAEVVSVCNEAAMLAIESNRGKISFDDLLHSISHISPQITHSTLQFYEKFESANRI